MEQQALFESQYEDEYLLRSLGQLAYRSDIALSELVANAWDAGATEVDITIPKVLGAELVIEDDGTGLSRDQFIGRWMTLAYNRLKRQGDKVTFPPGREGLTRLAYGRNGVGRHGLLCFNDQYTVETRCGGQKWTFDVATASGASPFVLRTEKTAKARGHGTKLSVRVSRHLPNVDELTDVLSARFMHDPQFKLRVNGKAVPLEDHSGVIERCELTAATGEHIEAFLIDATKSHRRSRYSGIAFWVGGRLVGVPSWLLGGRAVLDGRLRQAKQFTVIARCDGLRPFVRPDWSAFNDMPQVRAVFDVVGDFVEEALRRDAVAHAEDVAVDALQVVRPDLERLPTGARIEVAEFAQSVVTQHPSIPPDVLATAVKAAIQLENSRSGQSLLEKLARLPEGDLAALDRLLGEWSVRDALTVLDEIDSRLSVISAIDRLSADKTVDELHTLHPLVVKARWAFGPQFDSPEFVSNRSIRRAVEEAFGLKVEPESFLNPLKRPDLIVAADRTIYAVGTTQFEGEMTKLGDVLVVELKRGGFKIGRDEVNQASNYVEDLLKSGHLDGVPNIHAFVVGHEIDKRVESKRTVGEGNRGRIEVITFDRMVTTANRRLFRLRDQLPQRYEELSGQALLTKALGGAASQSPLFKSGE
jgi:hypothetical protein